MFAAWINSFGNKKNIEADSHSDIEQKKSATIQKKNATNPERDPEMGLLDDTFQTNKDEEKRLEGHGKKKIIALVFVLFALVLVGLLLCVAASEERTSSGGKYYFLDVLEMLAPFICMREVVIDSPTPSSNPNFANDASVMAKTLGWRCCCG